MPVLSALSGLPELNAAQQQRLLHCARTSIAATFEGQREFTETVEDIALSINGAAFVTLEIAQQLRGCIGSLQAHRRLIEDVWHNAQAAAFRDPRFLPLQKDELTQLTISLSIIGVAQAINTPDEQSLLAQLRRHQHGIIVEDRGHRATFLPQVWSHFDNAQDFLHALRRKAGLTEKFETSQRYSVYQTLSIK